MGTVIRVILLLNRVVISGYNVGKTTAGQRCLKRQNKSILALDVRCGLHLSLPFKEGGF